MRPMLFMSRDPSEFLLAVSLGYVTEMQWPRRPGKTPYKDLATSVYGENAWRSPDKLDLNLMSALFAVFRSNATSTGQKEKKHLRLKTWKSSPRKSVTSHRRTFTAKCTSLTQRYCNYCFRFVAFLTREIETGMSLSEPLLIDLYNNSFMSSRLSSFYSRACEVELLFSCSTLRGRITVSI